MILLTSVRIFLIKIKASCNCGENAECVPNFQTKRYDCKCKYGFTGDGYACTPLPCNEYSNCNENARCDLTPKGAYECRCNPGKL